MAPARHIPLNASHTASYISTREIWRLAWPQFLMMCCQFMVGLTDVWVAGQIHRDAQAVLGIITQCQFILIIVGTAFANASVAAMSQSLGAGLPERARRYAGLVLKIALVFSTLALLFALFFRHGILSLMRVPAEILPLAEEFWGVFLIVLPSHYLLAVTGAMFRARRSVYIPLFTAFMAFVINAFASTGFGLGWWGMPNFGAKGIAYATFLSVTSMALFNLVVLIKRGVIVKSSFAPWGWEKKALPYLVKVAIPAGGMQFSWQLGYLVLYTIVASLPFGSVDALAGMAAGMRVESVLFLPAFALNMTASTLVGHCLGAGDEAAARRLGWKLVIGGSISMTLAAACLWPFLRELAAFIVPDAHAQEHALIYLRYNLLATPFAITSMCLGGIFTGAGAAVYTFFVFGLAIWGVRLPLAYIFGHLVWQSSDGVFLGMFVSQIFQACIILYIFKTRDWARFAMIRRHARH
ncbi:MAG: putative FMN/FAD exporter YeeO [Desulfovibrio sp.]